MSAAAELLRSAWEEVSGRGIFVAVVFLTACILAVLVLSHAFGLAAGVAILVLLFLFGAITVEESEEDDIAVELNTQEQLLEYSHRATKRRDFFMRKLARMRGAPIREAREDEQEDGEEDAQDEEGVVFEDEDDNAPEVVKQLELAARLQGRLESLRQLEDELKKERDAAAEVEATAASSGTAAAETANCADGELSEAAASGTIPTSALFDEAAEAAQLLRLRPRRRVPLDTDSKLLGKPEPESSAEHAADAEPPG